MRFPPSKSALTINVPVVYMGRYKVVSRGDNRYIGCFMYQPRTYNMRIYMPMYVICNIMHYVLCNMLTKGGNGGWEGGRS